MLPRMTIMLDFDGTITRQDTTDLILESFARASWRDVEQDWEAGRIGSMECMRRQVALIRASAAELDAFADQIAVDPHFPDLAHQCRARGIPLTIVSDGLDRVIMRVLARYDLRLPVRANRLVALSGGHWSLAFPNAASECGAGTCKCGLALAESEAVVLIGDGRSDFCVAETAQIVFAKSKLADHCRRNGISYLPFETLGDVAQWLTHAPVRTLKNGAIQ